MHVRTRVRLLPSLTMARIRAPVRQLLVCTTRVGSSTDMTFLVILPSPARCINAVFTKQTQMIAVYDLLSMASFRVSGIGNGAKEHQTAWGT